MPQMQGHGARGSRQRFLAEMAQEQAEREGLEPVDKRLKVVSGVKGKYHSSAIARPTALATGEEITAVRHAGQKLRTSAGRSRTVTRAEAEAAADEAADRPTRALLDTLSDLRRRRGISKREPLKTHVSEQDAHRLVREHGMTGPLPGHLSREQRMAAYEARYVASGGRKGEKWQRRAVTADKVKNVGLAGATGAGAALLASRTKTGVRAGQAIGRAAGHIPGVRRMNRTSLGHHAENAGIASAVAGGAGELYAGHARRRRASYASAPAGVAASALRRMQDYTPEHR